MSATSGKSGKSQSQSQSQPQPQHPAVASEDRTKVTSAQHPDKDSTYVTADGKRIERDIVTSATPDLPLDPGGKPSVLLPEDSLTEPEDAVQPVDPNNPNGPDGQATGQATGPMPTGPRNDVAGVDDRNVGGGHADQKDPGGHAKPNRLL